MLLVIFGAGASFDSYAPLPPSATHELRLPLAKDLFGERFRQERNQFPIIGPLVPRLYPSDGDFDVEQQLSIIEREQDRDPKRTSQLLAIRFYLKKLIQRCQSGWMQQVRDSSNYHALLDALRGRDIRKNFVTFNYDSLLEKAIEHEGIGLPTLSSYIANRELSLFKLHGSID